MKEHLMEDQLYLSNFDASSKKQARYRRILGKVKYNPKQAMKDSGLFHVWG